MPPPGPRETLISAMDKKLSEDLEAVRGVAALIVLIAHTAQWFVLPLIGIDHPFRTVISTSAHLAVLVFFVLSGYVVTHSLVKNYERNQGIDAGGFIVARLARIVPPGVFAVILSAGVAAVILGFGLHGSISFRTASDLYVAREAITIDPTNILACVFFSNGLIPGTGEVITNGPLWSLSIEFWLYFVALLGSIVITERPRGGRGQNSLFSCAVVGLLMFGLLMVFQIVDFWQYALYWAMGSMLLLASEFEALSKLRNFIFFGFLAILIVAK
jgi:peptidoglycan/LPS O-acetylase OafA/YrhL